MLSLLVPVILIEGILLSQALSLHWLTATFISLKANLTSTILGCPIAWFLQFATSFLVSIPALFYDNEMLEGLSNLAILASFILPSPELEEKLFWLLPLCGIVGLGPAYLVSVWFEYPFICKQAQEKKINPKSLMYRVNLFSYALLLGVWCLRLALNLLHGVEVNLLSCVFF
ncbi:MAG: hypothetical protein WGN25_13795 [Candidatus Electrothrix sp. GW3-4]|uniref:hypothetical protein n=1 Tax=Candidatus Electrothrix sp. GW3-4 TaxID=3126740 RepID=UPI0030D4F603